VRVILFGPRAAEIAQSPEVQAELAAAARKGQAWKLLPVESGQSWGAASTALVHALMDEHALAIVALDRNAGHLAEQLALKSFVPVSPSAATNRSPQPTFRGYSDCRQKQRRQQHCACSRRRRP